MNTKQTEALKLALEVLEEINKLSIGENAICLPAEIDTAMDAIREALAEQPAQQEPVAWYFVRDLEKGISFAPDNDATKSWQPLYPALPAATEPVAWMVYTLDGKSVCVTDNPNDFTDQHKALPLYTTPPQRTWVGLTADEIWKCNKAKSGSAVEFHICYEHQNVEDFAESIEAKLKEKNHG